MEPPETLGKLTAGPGKDGAAAGPARELAVLGVNLAAEPPEPLRKLVAGPGEYGAAAGPPENPRELAG